MVQRRYNGDRSIGMDDDDAADAWLLLIFAKGGCEVEASSRLVACVASVLAMIKIDSQTTNVCP